MTCPRLTSTLHEPTPGFTSLLEASTISGLVGDGLVAASCVPRGWQYQFTRSTAGNYPRGSLAAFFHKEQTVANCPYLGWGAPYLSDAFLDRPVDGCGGVVVDIGANIGLAVLPPASLGWRVLAIEPNAQNVDRLRLNVALNGWSDEHVTVLTAAAADRNGTAMLFSPPSKHAAISSLTPSNVQHFRRTGADAIGQQPTRLLRLDEYFAHADPRLWASVRVIKIDTQGHELPVLWGLGKLLGAPPYPVLLMEFEVPLQRGAGFGDGTRVLDYLRQRGYRAFCTVAASTGRAESRPAATGDALSDRVLPGHANEGGQSTESDHAWSATWRLGTALVPQSGAPDCIGAKRRSNPRLSAAPASDHCRFDPAFRW